MNAAKASRWERRPDDRTSELLEAALEVFARQGYRSARLDEVAEAAGVTKGTIYHYFDTKEALLTAVIEHYHTLAFGRAEQVLRDERLPASTRIRLLMRKMFSSEEPRRLALLSLMIRGVAHEVPHLHERWLRDGPVWFWTLVGRLVDDGKRRGEFRPDADGDVAARMLVSGLLLQLMWQQHADAVPDLAVDTDRLIDSSVELFLASLRAAPLAGPQRA
jgi:AcrR family transcriptional regulator